jgi:alkylation response protein AidB-like acyl-CoA dehydrogenase
MDFTHSERSLALQRRVEDFMQQHVVPVENAYYDEVRESGHPYRTPQVLQALKAKAREAGLWNRCAPERNSPPTTAARIGWRQYFASRLSWRPSCFVLCLSCRHWALLFWFSARQSTLSERASCLAA